MAMTQVNRCSRLATTAEEISRFALTKRIVGKQTVAHFTVAVHAIVAYFPSHAIVNVAESFGVAGPCVAANDIDGVVIAEAVALFHLCVHAV